MKKTDKHPIKISISIDFSWPVVFVVTIILLVVIGHPELVPDIIHWIIQSSINK